MTHSFGVPRNCFTAEGFDFAGVVTLLEPFFLDDSVGHLASDEHLGKHFFTYLLGDDAFIDDLGEGSDVGGSQLALSDVERTIAVL